MAHEMMHALDAIGRNVNKMGIYIPLWTGDSIFMYNIKEDSIRRQFSQYKLFGHSVSNV